MELEEILQALCGRVPEAIAAVLCDFEGELVVSARGEAQLPEGAEESLFDHVPRARRLTIPEPEYLLRLAAAEPCAILRMFHESGARIGLGALREIEVRYASVDMLVRQLSHEYYVVLFLRRPSLMALARHGLRAAGLAIEPHLA
ncbi:MAG: hypothetical protein IPK13_18425 [Deltaproteobacteria bacterium]|nr:hypothetical protein [Deltaproteobacteria bacterium]